ncbi:hypothetical protein AWB90_01505 [Mycobacterium paraense]|uniref:Proline rich protein n=1 Tax=Mycobacterium paraense TaxID=767916 RepID=A0A1X2AQW6_9MYCO|nr:hypothetical protein [Mycobacterium paraense]ORW53808.1 hypothetical protein AWB90_01505 [Mycobacterium paraense]
MTETPEPTIEPTTVTGPPRHDYRYGASSRLGQAAAWVVIVAGTLFVVSVILFWGLLFGWSSGSHYGWYRGYYGGHSGGCPMMGPGGMGGMMGPGGMMPPPQTPSAPTPPTPRP